MPGSSSVCDFFFLGDFGDIATSGFLSSKEAYLLGDKTSYLDSIFTLFYLMKQAASNRSSSSRGRSLLSFVGVMLSSLTICVCLRYLLPFPSSRSSSII